MEILFWNRVSYHFYVKKARFPRRLYNATSLTRPPLHFLLQQATRSAESIRSQPRRNPYKVSLHRVSSVRSPVCRPPPLPSSSSPPPLPLPPPSPSPSSVSRPPTRPIATRLTYDEGFNLRRWQEHKFHKRIIRHDEAEGLERKDSSIGAL